MARPRDQGHIEQEWLDERRQEIQEKERRGEDVSETDARIAFEEGAS